MFDGTLMLFAIVAVYILIFLICAIAMRAIFCIPQIVRHHKAHTKLLSELAKVQGVDSLVIEKIIADAETKDFRIK